ncbi:hypothetical protein NDU88_001446 [Pleurodeles waltl]|uniref:Uncharacterized protein n=1 Tax=Pleurodeles waltl TaxID=8319 RepID=A0AAV7SAH2_PLEWA|nr:hypothetical protein NDU88_001446 [Pleurodeles waltl]
MRRVRHEAWQRRLTHVSRPQNKGGKRPGTRRGPPIPAAKDPGAEGELQQGAEDEGAARGEKGSQEDAAGPSGLGMREQDTQDNAGQVPGDTVGNQQPLDLTGGGSITAGAAQETPDSFGDRAAQAQKTDNAGAATGSAVGTAGTSSKLRAEGRAVSMGPSQHKKGPGR